MSGQRKLCPAPVRDIREPIFKAPPGSCDSHVHIVGPQNIYPLMPGLPHDMPDSTLDDYRKVQSALNIPRALIVASGGHKFDYHHLVHILCLDPVNYRGVAILPTDITDREMAMLDDMGVVGARFYSSLNPPDRHTMARINEIGWSAHFTVPNTERLDQIAILADEFDCPIVLEHAGRPNPEDGVEGSHFQKVLGLLDTGRCWIKLSPRFSNLPNPPYEDSLPFIEALVQNRPDRLLYGSDYPHPNFWHPMPNEADLLDLVPLWISDTEVQEQIMVRNAETLFGFAPWDQSTEV